MNENLINNKYIPDKVCKHCPVSISHTFTVESAFPDTKILSLSSMPDVKD